MHGALEAGASSTNVLLGPVSKFCSSILPLHDIFCSKLNNISRGKSTNFGYRYFGIDMLNNFVLTISVYSKKNFRSAIQLTSGDDT